MTWVGMMHGTTTTSSIRSRRAIGVELMNSLQAMLEGELDEALARGTPAAATRRAAIRRRRWDRHGHRSRQLSEIRANGNQGSARSAEHAQAGAGEKLPGARGRVRCAVVRTLP